MQRYVIRSIRKGSMLMPPVVPRAWTALSWAVYCDLERRVFLIVTSVLKSVVVL